MRSDARRVLENVIFPAVFGDRRVRELLFVGVAPYTNWYSRAFDARPGLRFWTVDSDPEAQRWGAPRRHRVARFEALGQDPEVAEKYDLVVMNGLFGYGTDSADQTSAVVDAAHRVLKPGGRLLIGYSNEGTFEPEHVNGERFCPAPIPGIGTHRYVTRNENRHTFVCFTRSLVGVAGVAAARQGTLSL